MERLFSDNSNSFIRGRHAKGADVAVKARDTFDYDLVKALDLPVPRRSWKLDASCKEADPVIFSLSSGESPKSAREICKKCPVRQECLASAIGNRETDGVWGGMTLEERRKLIRKGRALLGNAEKESA